MASLKDRLIPVENKGNSDLSSRLIPVNNKQESTSEEPEESGLMNAIRWVMQLAGGAADVTTYGLLTGLNILGSDVFSDEEFEDAEKMYDRFIKAGYPPEELTKPNREEYEKAKKAAVETYPTIGNISREIEERTGAPLLPKTPGQKALRLATSGYRLGGVPGAAVAGGGSPLLQAAGVPEVIADPVALAAAAVIQRALPKGAAHPSEIGIPVKQEPSPPPPGETINVAPVREGLPQIEFKGQEPPVPPTVDVKPQSPRNFNEVLTDIREGGIPQEEGAMANRAAGEAIGEVVPLGENAGGFESEYDVGKAIKAVLPRVREDLKADEILPLKQPNPKQSRSLEGRATNEVHRNPLRITPRVTSVSSPEATMTKSVQDIFSPNSFDNYHDASVTIKDQIDAVDRRSKEFVDERYQISREANRDMNAVYPGVVNELQEYIRPIAAIAHPSPPQRTLLTAVGDIINMLMQIEPGEGGEPPSIIMNPVSNQQLIDQIQSLNSRVDYDFVSGGSKNNILKPIAGILSRAVTRVAATNPHALDAWEEAKQAQQDRSLLFQNDYIQPWRDRSNFSYKKLFNQIKDPDNFNIIKNVLDLTEGGRAINRALQGVIANDQLKSFKKDPSKADPEELEQAIRDLNPTITPEQGEELRTLFHRRSRKKKHEPITFRAEKKEKPEKHPLEDKPYEQIARITDSLSGWDKLEALMTDKDLLERVKQFKINDILQNGKITPADNPKPFADLLNDREVVKMLGRLMGKDQLNKLRRLVQEWEWLELYLSKLEKNSKQLDKLGIKKEKVSKTAQAVSTSLRAVLHPIRFARRLSSPKNVQSIIDHILKLKHQPAEEQIKDIIDSLSRDFDELHAQSNK